MLRETARELGGELVEFACAVEERVVAMLAEVKPDRPRYANVEFYAGVVMEICGIPRDMFTPTFAVSRVVGWVGQRAGTGHRATDHPPRGPLRRAARAAARARLIATRPHARTSVTRVTFPRPVWLLLTVGGREWQ